MGTHAVETGAGPSRRTRRETLARWAPWGPTARRPVVERRAGPRLALGYLVRHALGVEVTGLDGGRIGVVEELRDPTFDFWPSELVVRTDAGERLLIRSDRVVRARPRDGRLVVEPEPAAKTTPWTSGSRSPRKRGTTQA
jgi:hypothetical protein